MSFDELRRDIEEHIEHETRDNIDRGSRYGPQGRRFHASGIDGYRHPLQSRPGNLALPRKSRLCAQRWRLYGIAGRSANRGSPFVDGG